VRLLILFAPPGLKPNPQKSAGFPPSLFTTPPKLAVEYNVLCLPPSTIVENAREHRTFMFEEDLGTKNAIVGKIVFMCCGSVFLVKK